MIPDDVELGLGMIARRYPDILLRKQYRAGHHRLTFATEQFRSTFGRVFTAFSLNLCPTVIDAVADRLQIAGFADTGGQASGELEAADVIWEASVMEARAGEVHSEALTAADAYVMVWPDEDGMPFLYPQSAEQVWVRYDDERLGRIRFAIKAWEPIDGPLKGHVRVTVYYDDRIERYVTKRKGTMPDKAAQLRELTPQEGGGEVPHAWEIVPVFHFPNNAAPGHHGTSKLDDVIPVNDALNKTVLDLLVGSEAQALPQRWVAGSAEVEKDPLSGRSQGVAMRPGEILDLGDVAARAGQFQAADLRQLVEVKESFCLDVARVSKTPLHLVKQSGDWPSGEALKTAEAPLVKECRDRIASWGPVWASAMGLALRMGGVGAEGAVRTLYDSPETKVSEREAAETAEAKQRAGIPRKQTWRELGYTDEQIEQFELDLDEQKRRDIENAQAAFNRGGGGDGE